MNKIKNIAVLLLILFIAMGCEKFLDVNTDPNYPTDVKPEYLLASGEGGLAYYMGFEMNYKALLICQHWSTIYSQYWDTDKYRLLPTDYDNTWSNNYADVLYDLKEANKLAEEAGKTNIAAIAKILMAYTFAVNTDTWGDIPYSQALKIEETFTPAYDAQKDVYLGLLADLESAVSELSGDIEPALTTQDIIFNGDIAKWKSFANTIQLRLLIRMSDTDEFDATKVNALISGGQLIGSNDGNANFTYGTSDGNFNPLYERFNSPGRSKDLSASSTLVDLLKNLNDPRLEVYFDMSPDTNVYVGNPNGYGAQIENNYARISYSWWEPGNKEAQTRPTQFLTAAESYFLQAEAVAAGYTSGDAASLYNQGVLASMVQWGVSDDDANTYLAAHPYENMESIYLQKYIALYDQGPELYATWRKNDYPALEVVANSQNGNRIPVKFPYPYNETSTNSNNIPNTDINTRVWWDKQ